MADSYDPASGLPKDRVRLLVGDVNAARFQLTDVEIAAILTAQPDVMLAAADAARAIAARVGRSPDLALARALNVKLSQVAQHFFALADRLQQQGAQGAGAVLVGATNAEIDAADADTARRQPRFKRDQFRHPGTPKNDPKRGFE